MQSNSKPDYGSTRERVVRIDIAPAEQKRIESAYSTLQRTERRARWAHPGFILPAMLILSVFLAFVGPQLPATVIYLSLLGGSGCLAVLLARGGPSPQEQNEIRAAGNNAGLEEAKVEVRTQHTLIQRRLHASKEAQAIADRIDETAFLPAELADVVAEYAVESSEPVKITYQSRLFQPASAASASAAAPPSDPPSP